MKFNLRLSSVFGTIDLGLDRQKRDRLEENLSRSHYQMICESEREKKCLLKGLNLSSLRLKVSHYGIYNRILT